MVWVHRTNSVTAALIDQAIGLDDVVGGIAARQLLQDHGVEVHVIARVLLEPEKRRAATRPAPAQSEAKRTHLDVAANTG